MTSGRRLSGKVALVTGASRGIGAAIAQTLGLDGAQVIVHYHKNKEKAEQVKETIESYGGLRSTIMQADVGDYQSVIDMFDQIDNTYGELDIMVNNAGVFGPVGKIEDVPLEELEQAFQTNFWGSVYTTREALPRMKIQGGGSLIYVSSNVFSEGTVICRRPVRTSKGYANPMDITNDVDAKGVVSTLCSANRTVTSHLVKKL